MSALERKLDEPTVVSASGKVLLAGGYLVLDQKYSGVVVSTSSRFYTVINSARNRKEGLVTVRSPQFKDAIWEYYVQVGDDVNVTQPEGAPKNKFVFIALQLTLRLVAELKGLAHLKSVFEHGLDITIVGGNDFYSQRAKLAELGLEPRISSLAQIPPFAHTGVPISEVHKTGLGSSAALTTSLAIPVLSGDDTNVHIVHAASQAAHCIAQGKVGSGFDVAAAVFGSHKYTRFNPNVLAPLMGDAASGNVSLLPVLGVENKAWDHKVEPFQLPPGTRLMLADVDAGSDTPSLVGKVLKWHKASGAESVALWDALAASNEAFAAALLHLSELQSKYEELYNRALAQLTHLPASQWRTTDASDVIIQTFINVHKLAEDIRAKMRDMGNRAGVPIEPPEQTALLDACIAQEGVIAGGVPGAGGYDAVWVLVFDPRTTDLTDTENTPLHRVERVWADWKDLDVSPLSAAESFEKGLRRERVESVPGLAEALEDAV
ncbi:Phosphomevalonate kinase [Fomitiporia mediterranea MF3/22]|uniref:Phosphomevalonate kinase n=1 Tax=Fomitiporia mediterranea (strain MF3/22) TaxID=694068 RepID=UPI0004407905|nr:Phosphomevalonate kinase [Fomitiporia mediterranea MF3/22]EJD03369.1 Phosphomevalonate kinase [Fomitiporia mediterranea MF3/22]